MKLKQLSKIYMLLILLLTVSIGLFAQKPYIINGQIGKDQEGMMTIKYTNGNKDFTDSVKVVDGKFSLQGQLTEPLFASLVFMPVNKSIQGQYREIYLDPVAINISGNSTILTADINGGPSMADFVGLMNSYKPIVKKGGDLDKGIAKAKEEDDQNKMKELGVVRGQLMTERKAIQDAFIKSHPDSYVAFTLWARKAQGFIEPDKIEAEFNAFSKRMKNTIEGKKITVRLETAKKLLPGKMAPDFTLNDVSGKAVSLSSLKGKNVVLIFWARNYMPFEPVSFAINKISRQLKQENLVILSVYYDVTGTPYKWKTVLEESALTADNIINVKDSLPLARYDSMQKSEVMKTYDMNADAGIHAYLISPEGKILIRAIDLYKDPVADIKKALGK